jgi:putative membrane protein
MQLTSNIREKYSPKKIISFLISFYIIGLIGISIPFSREIFIKLTPYALIFNFLLLLIYQKGKSKDRDLIAFILVYLLGYTVEIAGVETGIIFGEYHYGSGLGLKLFDVPLMIGLNWLLLVYISYSIFSFIKIKILRVFAASSAMVFYDFFVEQVADFMDMWYWEKASVPIENYFAWFVISFVLLSIFAAFNVNTKNKLALPIYTIQLVFFALIFIAKIYF